MRAGRNRRIHRNCRIAGKEGSTAPQMQRKTISMQTSDPALLGRSFPEHFPIKDSKSGRVTAVNSNCLSVFSENGVQPGLDIFDYLLPARFT